MTLTLRCELDTAIYGNWDGGAKHVFNWNIDRLHSSNGQTAVGSWEANYFFSVKTGKTDKQTLGYAKRALSSRLRRKGMKAKFNYVEK